MSDDTAASLSEHMQDMADIICEYGCEHLGECDCFNSMASDFLEAKERIKELEDMINWHYGRRIGKNGQDHRLHIVIGKGVLGEKDPDKCPKCGGNPDNGFDRCMPPNAYHCTKCETVFKGATKWTQQKY